MDDHEIALLLQQFSPPIDPQLILALAAENPPNLRDDLEALKAAIADDVTATHLDHDDVDVGGCGDDERLKFLKRSFPGQKVGQLSFVLRRCGGDVDRAVDEILNHELLDEERRVLAVVDGGEEGGAVDELFYATGGGRWRARKGRRRGEGRQGRHTQEEVEEAVGNGSVWDKMTGQVDWVGGALHLPREVVTSAFHKHRGSLAGALYDLVEHRHAPSIEDIAEIEVKERDKLVGPGQPEPDFAVVLQELEGRARSLQERLTKKMPGLGRAQIENAIRHTYIDELVAEKVCGILGTFRPFDISTEMAKTSLSSTAPRDTATPRTDIASGPGIDRDPDGLTARECLARVEECLRRRDDAFAKASAAHRRLRSEGAGAGGASATYAASGREWDAKLRAWKLRHARQAARERSLASADAHLLADYATPATANPAPSVAAREHVDSGHFVDLHGLSVAQALIIVREGVNRWYAQEKLLEPSSGGVHGGLIDTVAARSGKGGLIAVRPYRIVTGVGRHSSGGEARILPAVEKMLTREGYRYESRDGQVVVRGLVK